MNKRTIFLISVLVFTILSLSFVEAAITITWKSPDSDGYYYWQNFVVNVTTNDNANCSYKIDYWNGTNAISWSSMDGNGTILHNATVDISLLPSGYKFNITVYCENATNYTDNVTSQRWFYRDYECGDDVHSSWVLGHDLDCKGYAGHALFISSDSSLDCNGHKIITASNYNGITISSNSNNVTVKNCVVTNATNAFFLQNSNNVKIIFNTIYDSSRGIMITPIVVSSNITIANNTILNTTSYEGIRIDEYWSNVVIANNTIKNTYTSGILVEGTKGNGYVNITNNFVNNTGYEGLALHNLTNGETCYVLGNVITYNDQKNNGYYSLEIYNVTSGLTVITENTITNSTSGGVKITESNQTNVRVYRNKIYSLPDPKVYVDKAFYLDYGSEGNYWGYDGNVCPGFVAGKDSNRQDVIDRFPFTDGAFTNPACSCGDLIKGNVTLYRNLTCYSSHGLIVDVDNVVIDCNGNWLSSNGTYVGIHVGGASGFENVTISNCNFNNTYHGIAAYHSFNVSIQNSSFYNDTVSGIYSLNVTHLYVVESKFENSTYALVVKNVSDARLLSLNILASYGLADNWGIYVENTTTLILRDTNITTRTPSTATLTCKGFYAKNTTGIMMEDVNVNGDYTNTGFLQGIYLADVNDSTLNRVYLNDSYSFGLFISGFRNISVLNSVTVNKFVAAGNDGVYAIDGNDLTLENVTSNFINIVNSNTLTINNVSMSDETYYQYLYVQSSTNVTVVGGSLNRIVLDDVNYTKITRTTLNNTCPSSTESGCVYTIRITSSNDVNITNNNVLFDYSSGVKGFHQDLSNDVHIDGNYWGHSECPLYLYGRDTDVVNPYDSSPYGSLNGWDSGQPPACSYVPSVLEYSIRMVNGTPIYHPNNTWYYYYDNDTMNATVIVRFNVSQYHFRVAEAKANFSEVDGNTNLVDLTNLNATLGNGWWELNYTLGNVSNGAVNGSVRHVYITFVDNAGYNTTVVFTILLNVQPSDYYPELGGSTTDWSTIADFSHVEGLTFEVPNLGKIEFLEPVNLLDQDFINSLTKLAEYLRIGFARVSLNSTLGALKALNVSANITMYNLVNFTEPPGILRDGLPDVQAGQTSGTYVNNVEWNDITKVLKFSVNSWSEYEADGIPPTVEIIEPQNKTYYVEDVEDYDIHLRYVASDDTGVSECWYQIVGVTRAIAIPGCQNITIDGNGTTVRLTVSVKDSVGHQSYDEVIFSVRKLKSDGSSCTHGYECLGGYCVHGYCRSSPTYCGDGYCDEGETSASCSSDCGSRFSYKSEEMKKLDFVFVGQVIEFKPKDVNVPVEEIKIVPRKNSKGVIIRVRKLSGRPSGVEKEPFTKPYKWFEIKVNNLSVENAKIKFKVSVNWLEAHNLSADDVALYRYSSGVWNMYEPSIIDEKYGFVYYEVSIPSFSVFAIGEKVSMSQPTIENKTEEEEYPPMPPVPPASPEENETTTTTVPEAAPTVEKKVEDYTTLTIIFLVALVITAIVFFLRGGLKFGYVK